MIEIHPFGDFIPTTTHYLLLGSFTSKPSNNYLWFYSNGRNHFWSIMEKVYGLELSTKEKQQKLFKDLNEFFFKKFPFSFKIYKWYGHIILLKYDRLRC